MPNLVDDPTLSVADLDNLTGKIGTAAKSDASLQEMNAESVKKICKDLSGPELEQCILRNRKGSARRKTRGRRRGGGLRLFTRRHNPPPRPHKSFVGYANKGPLEGPHRPIPAEWVKKHRETMGNQKKGARRRITRRR